MIHVRKLDAVNTDKDSRQEMDRDFLRTGYRRRLFVASDPSFFWRGRPTRSKSPLLVYPIPVAPGSSSLLRYLDAGGQVKELPLEAGRSYYIPPEVPYQFEARGLGAMEILSPIPANGQLLDEETLPDEFFTDLDSQANKEQA